MYLSETGLEYKIKTFAIFFIETELLISLVHWIS